MTKFKRWYLNILYRLLDKATAPEIKHLPPVVKQSPRPDTGYQRIGGNAAVWHYLQNRKIKRNSFVNALELYTVLEDTRWLSVHDLSDKMGVDKKYVGAVLSHMESYGFIEAKRVRPTVAGTRTVKYYRRRLVLKNSVLGDA